MSEMIRTENLTKHFGNVHSVEGVSLSVQAGDIYGFLGLNGAGKTTTIRMLLGMVRPSDGQAYLFGHQVNARNPSLWQDVGCIVETPFSYPDLSVFENLEMMRKLRGLSDPNKTFAIMQKLNLMQLKDRPAKQLSLGNAQRLGIAKALIYNPKLVILDEPTNGLDPAGIVEIRALLINMARLDGVTIFISSHILGEISKLATHLGIIHAGRLVQELTMSELAARIERKLVLTTSDNPQAFTKLTEAGYPVKQNVEGQLEIRSESVFTCPQNVTQLLCESGLPPSMIQIKEEDLETYFLRAIGTYTQTAL